MILHMLWNLRSKHGNTCLTILFRSLNSCFQNIFTRLMLLDVLLLWTKLAMQLSHLATDALNVLRCGRAHLFYSLNGGGMHLLVNKILW